MNLQLEYGEFWLVVILVQIVSSIQVGAVQLPVIPVIFDIVIHEMLVVFFWTLNHGNVNVLNIVKIFLIIVSLLFKFEFDVRIIIIIEIGIQHWSNYIEPKVGFVTFRTIFNHEILLILNNIWLDQSIFIAIED